jgi:citrate/tricarballylate utilization protein
MHDVTAKSEALRQLEICHACRYCEGYCDMFGALNRLPLLAEADVAHLATVCHDCRACYQACMYTDPHEFDVNIPKALASIRAEIYDSYAPPARIGSFVHKRPWSALICALLISVAALIFIAASQDLKALGRAAQGDFYSLIPGWLMIVFGLATGLFAAIAITAGQSLFWRKNYKSSRLAHPLHALTGALRRAALMSAMRGGGDGCYYPHIQTSSHLRRWFHILTAYGFLATFAATCAAAIQEHVLGEPPPYSFWSAPVLLGTIGGIALLLGAIGLLLLKRRSSPAFDDRHVRSLEYSFLVVLILLAASGLALLAFRNSPAMPALLIVHLGLVGGFFVTLPYGKMVHAFFRISALLVEQMRRNASRSPEEDSAAPNT